MLHHRGGKVAYPALLGALSMLFLYGASILPSGVWAAVAVAGLGPCAAVASLGISVGFLCWGGVSLLSLFLLPDKICALLFAALFGLYPMIKSVCERLKKPIAWLLKLCFFNLSFTVVFWITKELTLGNLSIMVMQYGILLLYLAANLVFCVYDFGLTKLICLYMSRVDRAIGKRLRR